MAYIYIYTLWQKVKYTCVFWRERWTAVRRQSTCVQSMRVCIRTQRALHICMCTDMCINNACLAHRYVYTHVYEQCTHLIWHAPMIGTGGVPCTAPESDICGVGVLAAESGDCTDKRYVCMYACTHAQSNSTYETFCSNALLKSSETAHIV